MFENLKEFPIKNSFYSSQFLIFFLFLATVESFLNFFFSFFSQKNWLLTRNKKWCVFSINSLITINFQSVNPKKWQSKINNEQSQLHYLTKKKYIITFHAAFLVFVSNHLQKQNYHYLFCGRWKWQMLKNCFYIFNFIFKTCSIVKDFKP